MDERSQAVAKAVVSINRMKKAVGAFGALQKASETK
jgi:hypothetical protein